MSISLTEKAAKRAKRYLDSRGKGVALNSVLKRPAAQVWHIYLSLLMR